MLDLQKLVQLLWQLPSQTGQSGLTFGYMASDPSRSMVCSVDLHERLARDLLKFATLGLAAFSRPAHVVYCCGLVSFPLVTRCLTLNTLNQSPRRRMEKQYGK